MSHALIARHEGDNGVTEFHFSFSTFEEACCFLYGVEWVNDKSIEFDQPTEGEDGRWHVFVRSW